MQPIGSVVKVTVTRGVRTITKAGFGTPLIITDAASFTGIRSYQDINEVLEDFADTTPAYAAALALFSADVKPSIVKIGHAPQLAGVDRTPVQAAQYFVDQDLDWYGLMITSRDEAAAFAVATYIQTQRKLFYYATSDVASYDSASTTDFMAKVAAANFTRTVPLFSLSADTLFPEAAWMSNELPKDPGSYTDKFITLVGIPSDNLSSSQIAAIKAKNGNVYTNVGSADMVSEGTTGEGEFVDTIRFIDWLQAQIEENVFTKLVSGPKVPFTNKGIGSIEGQVRVALEAGVRAGGINEDYDVTVPDVSDVTQADRAARSLKGIKFFATLQGAVHFANIDGTVGV